MSQVMSGAVGNESSSRLEAMLREISAIEKSSGNYAKWAETEISLKALSLGIPITIDGIVLNEVNEESAHIFIAHSRHFRREAGELYRGKRKFAEAGKEFELAEDYGRAIMLYIEDGSDNSMIRAMEISSEQRFGFREVIDALIKKSKTGDALDFLEELRDDEILSEHDYSILGEHIVKTTYTRIIREIKEEIRKEGAEPKGRNMFEFWKQRKSFLAKGIYAFGYGFHIEDEDFQKTLYHISGSRNPKMLKIGIELCDILIYEEKSMRKGGTLGRNQEKLRQLQDKKLYFRGIMEDNPKIVNYFRFWAEFLFKKNGYPPDNDKGFKFDNPYARDAITLLAIHGKPDEALGFAERYLPPEHPTRFRVLDMIGDTQRIAKAYVEIGKPVEAALILTRAKS
ncbi:hypothetical protein J4458_07340 [Candidatus Woesearchaeota archaeon]|nr:hypothetical protein [Candidatus Woesearchaeota archaeon]